MQKSVAVFLQIAVVLIGIGVLAALLWEPWVEGVNANATTLREIYFDDPFLAYIYFAFIPVFIGFYKAFKLLGDIGRGETYSQKSALTLRAIKYCALSFAAFIFAALVCIFVAVRGSDDIAGGVAMGLFLTLASLVVATTATLFERKISKKLA